MTKSSNEETINIIAAQAESAAQAGARIKTYPSTINLTDTEWDILFDALSDWCDVDDIFSEERGAIVDIICNKLRPPPSRQPSADPQSERE